MIEPLKIEFPNSLNPILLAVWKKQNELIEYLAQQEANNNPANYGAVAITPLGSPQYFCFICSQPKEGHVASHEFVNGLK